jgi:predicted O-linked N-acetylglucosamine transferase (SPINDLY family)
MRLFNIHSCSLFELFLLGTTKPEQLEAQTRLKVVSHHLYLYRISTVEQISIATPGRDDFLDYI